VVGVVEALEVECPFSEVDERGEALLTEEALVEGVIEVLDGSVSPRLARRHEPGSHALMETEADDEAEAFGGGEGATVVELMPMSA